MGTSGPGNIRHIDNLYVKTFSVRDNTSITLGQFLIIEDAVGSAVVRPVIDDDFVGANQFLELFNFSVVQAAESANNLDTTNISLRKGQIECITKGSDWVTVMRTGVFPDAPVGILRVGTVDKFETSNKSDGTSPVPAGRTLGMYKHKEFSTVAEISAQDDNGIIFTGRNI